jgi:hypothetical protein
LLLWLLVHLTYSSPVMMLQDPQHCHLMQCSLAMLLQILQHLH